MFSVPEERVFRLRTGGVECDAEGLRVGGLPLLARGMGYKTLWRALPKRAIESALTTAYGIAVDADVKLRGIEIVAASLNS